LFIILVAYEHMWYFNIQHPFINIFHFNFQISEFDTNWIYCVFDIINLSYRYIKQIIHAFDVLHHSGCPTWNIF
jgi:hypothetical protein